MSKSRTPTGSKAMRLATIGTAVGLVGALTLVGAGLDDSDEDAVLEHVAERPALPEGSATPGYVGAEDTALDLATNLRVIESSPGEACPQDRLSVSWRDPGEQYQSGSHYTPVGPRPSGVESVNGVLYCVGSNYDHAGFNVDWDDGRWHADIAPDLGLDLYEGVDQGSSSDGGNRPDETPAGDAGNGGNDDDDPSALPAPSGPDDLVDRLSDAVIEVSDITDLHLTDSWEGIFDEFAIEDLAEYEPQTTCSPSPKAGTYGFTRIVLDAFPSTGTSGIGRACDQGGRSEHKEGRAWDWSALVSDRQDAAAASRVIGWLLATDEHGEQYAMARRLGLMYVIYNQSIWRAYAPEQGWVGYTGPNPHTDHVHFSFSRAGGLGDTSFWQVADLPDVSAMDFGPYSYLPDAGGVTAQLPWQLAATNEDRPHRPDRGNHDGTPSGGTGGGGGGTTVVPDAPDAPAPTPPVLPVPVPTLPPVLPLPTLPSGGGGGGGGGGLPLCPPGTPALPLPRHCLLPGL